MIDNYTVFIIFSTCCIIALLLGFISMIRDIYIDYMYIDIEDETEDIEDAENEILLDMLYD